MPKKAFKKKKHFQAVCRDKAKQGLVNHPDGTFRPYAQTRDDSMKRDYMRGYGFAV